MSVSVLIAVHNGEKWLEEAVASVVRQKHVDEILLIEDGSTDNSLSLCLKLERTTPKVHVFRHDDGKNHGAAASWNLGIQQAKSEFIAFLGADDIYLPNRFDLPQKILAENPAIDGVYEAIGTFFENETDRQNWYALGWGDLTTIQRVLPPEELFYHLVMWTAGHFSLDGLVVRKKLLQRVGGFNSILRLHQDTDICIKMAAVGRLVPWRITEPVAMRRVHSANRFLHAGENAIPNRLLLWRSLDNWAKKSGQSWSRRLVVHYGIISWLKTDARKQKKWLEFCAYFSLKNLLRAMIFFRHALAGAQSF